MKNALRQVQCALSRVSTPSKAAETGHGGAGQGQERDRGCSGARVPEMPKRQRVETQELEWSAAQSVGSEQE